jgi:hypothetical protein
MRNTLWHLAWQQYTIIDFISGIPNFLVDVAKRVRMHLQNKIGHPLDYVVVVAANRTVIDQVLQFNQQEK